MNIGAILGVISFVLPKVFEVVRGYGGQLWGLAGTVIAALPALIEAIGRLLKVISESALLSFLFGAALISPFAFWYGVSFDAPIRAKQERRAIDTANKRADTAIAAVEAKYAQQLQDIRTRLEQQTKKKR